MIGGSGETNISGDANKFSCTLAPEKLDGWVRWLCVSERELRKGERRKGEEVERERERERLTAHAEIRWRVVLVQ